MYQVIFDYIHDLLIGTITAPVVGSFDPVAYNTLLAHGLTVVSIVLLFILCIRFILFVSSLFGFGNR